MANEPDTLVVDHEEHGRLTIVRAAGGTAHHVEKRGTELGSRTGLEERAVVSRHAGGTGRDNQHGFFQLAEWGRVVAAGMTEGAGTERGATRHAARAPLGEARHERECKQIVEAVVHTRASRCLLLELGHHRTLSAYAH